MFHIRVPGGHDEKHRMNSAKLFAMFILLIIDVGMNSSLDYDSYNNYAGSNTDQNFPTVLLVSQIVIELSISVALFLVMADTYLFRVGLLGILLGLFWDVLVVHVLYILITIIEGTYRVQKLLNVSSVYHLWHDPAFITLSIIQKFGNLAFDHFTISIKIFNV